MLNRSSIRNFKLDHYLFGNAYLERVRAVSGKAASYRHSLAKYARRGVADLNQYYFVCEASKPSTPSSRRSVPVDRA